MPQQISDDDCPLAPGRQTRNIYCYAGLWCCYYLVAPVSYVGVTHANLLKSLGSSDTVANLPHAVFQWSSAFPVFVAWFYPQARLLKPQLVLCLVAKAVSAGVVALVIWLRLPAEWLIGSVIAFGAVFGASNGVMLSTLWELLRRGVSTARRGKALGLTFGIAPLLACGASAFQQYFADQHAPNGSPGATPSLNSFLVIFAAACPILIASAWIAAQFVVPLPSEEPPAERMTEIMTGLREFLTYRPVVVAAVAYMLVYSGGNAIIDTASIHARELLSGIAQDTVGYQNLIRFGFKAVAGVLFGWLLAKTSPKATLLATTCVLLSGMFWILSVDGRWYLVSFGLLGAGELFGVYFPNYVATASSKSRVRINVAYLNLTGSFVGMASILFGVISDRYGRIATFQTATGILLAALVLIIACLPTRPVPRDESAVGVVN
jgi:hypothetical protein